MVRFVSIAFALVVVGCQGSDDDPDGSDFKAVQGVPEVSFYGAVWSFAPDDVWVTADGGRALHYDGSTWTETALGTNETMLAIWAFGPDDMWMVGGNTLARYDGTAFTLTDLGQQNQGIEGVSSIWGSAPDDVWVGGSQSTAAHFDGTSWQRYLAAGTENTTMWGSGPDDVYTAGVFEVGHWDGSAWTDIEIDISISGAEGIWGFGRDDVWVADGSEQVAHFDGASWTVTEIDAFGGPNRLWGSSPDDLWGVGDFGSITHYDGAQWREVAAQGIGSPFLRSFFGVHGSGEGDLWLVGSELGDGGSTPLLWRYDPD